MAQAEFIREHESRFHRIERAIRMLKKQQIQQEDKLELLAREIQHLHVKMDRGFAVVDERFDKIESRLGKMERRFDKIDERLVLLDRIAEVLKV